MQMDPARNHGLALAVTGVFILSFDALLIRLANAGGLEVSFWRGFFVLIATGTICWFRRHSMTWPDTRRLWLMALAISVLYGANSVLFVLSVTHTHVANTVVILASAPLFAAAISWLFFRESTPRRTLISIICAIIGVLVVFSASIGQPGQLGDFLALILAVGMATMLTLLRRAPTLPRLPLLAAAGLVTLLISAPFAAPFELSSASLSWLALMGLVQIPIASLLIFSASRHLPSPEVSLVLLIETVMGPVWVWWVLSEELPSRTLLGGALILGAIAVNSFLSLRSYRAGKARSKAC
ncbi:DMT family transporter [Marinobacterium mangrovicola]|uniref:EamA domain-containing membrane protein RarD n=1 Tax=Marinobacterium mangrovicola TaxID=1476959 RepID=A0A4R1GNJ5_9GAMM|nr:DMT family transporter [Marinobacterium mangrovicola]TCK08931.1 EamA domain-containing membrane protein RarD [Marinobacterium mangrovicola]